MRHEARQVPSWLIFDVSQMKTLMLLFMLVGVLPCIAQLNPATEFTSGGKSRFSTKGNPKAKGLTVSLEHPKSWRAMDGDRPNIVQKFVSDSGRGLEFATISVRALPSGVTPTKDDLDGAFSAEGLKDMVPAGARIIETKRTKIDNQPAGYCVYVLADERANLKMILRVQTYVVYYRGYMIFFAFSVGDSDRKDSGQKLEARSRQFAPLYHLMANSIIIHDQYK